MSRLSQLGLILGILFLGQFIQFKLNLPIPATILGMIILLILMIFKIIKLRWVEDIGNTLLNNLSLLFIPSGVLIARELDHFKGKVIILTFIILVSTIIVMVVTGHTIQALEGKKRNKYRGDKS